MIVKKKKKEIENLASSPFVGLCATFESRKRKTRTLPSSYFVPQYRTQQGGILYLARG